MTNWFLEIRSVFVMECILRFRRLATPVLFLVLCGAAFMLMPQAGTGGVMFLIGQQRVLLNSAATALTSAIMGGLVFSLVGFYLISNSIGRDFQSGVGKLVAATPIPSSRYLVGKLLGNIVYLTLMVTVFMVSCMGMHLIRGEMRLEPMVFVSTFGIMFLPLIPCLAAISLMFECVPVLSGRGGDVFYFFFWAATLGLPPALVAASKGHPWILAADFTGMGFFVKEIITVTGTRKFTVGYAPFNAALSPVFFSGLKWIPELVLLRLASVLFTIPFFGIAWASFRRFDPARRKSHKRVGTGKIARARQTLISAWLRVVVPRGGWLTGSPSLVKAAVLDVRLTLALYPILFILIASSFFFSLLAPIGVIRASFLPAMFFVLVPTLASISTRDRVGNIACLIFSAPFVRRQFVFLKFISSLLLTLLIGFIPLIRLGLDDPFGALALLNGLLFVVAAATLLGLSTGTPKTFAVVFLLFLYVAVSSRNIPALDFAGWERIVTAPVLLGYAAASLLMVAAAWGSERWREIREK
jgi:hypothetical protein